MEMRHLLLPSPTACDVTQRSPAVHATTREIKVMKQLVRAVLAMARIGSLAARMLHREIHMSFRCAAALLFIAMPLSANAIPVAYDVLYDGSATGSPGMGSFSYDPDTSIFTDFIFAFGEQSALLSVPDRAWMFRFREDEGTLGELTFEILTGQDTDPLACGIEADCGTGFSLPSPFFSNIFFALAPSDPRTSYSVADSSGNIVHSGFLSATRQVPEPSTGMLFALGTMLAGFAVSRRRSSNVGQLIARSRG
jgi:hypothetical protein